MTKADAACAVRDIADAKTAKDEKTRPHGRAPTSRAATAWRAALLERRGGHVWLGRRTWPVRDSNPFVGVQLALRAGRERFLTKEEAGRFLDVIADLQSQSAMSEIFAEALRLFVAYRRSERRNTGCDGRKSTYRDGGPFCRRNARRPAEKQASDAFRFRLPRLKLSRGDAPKPSARRAYLARSVMPWHRVSSSFRPRAAMGMLFGCGAPSRKHAPRPG